jgi:hypothetical protein
LPESKHGHMLNALTGLLPRQDSNLHLTD